MSILCIDGLYGFYDSRQMSERINDRARGGLDLNFKVVFHCKKGCNICTCKSNIIKLGCQVMVSLSNMVSRVIIHLYHMEFMCGEFICHRKNS